jgi:hypothetical protein
VKTKKYSRERERGREGERERGREGERERGREGERERGGALHLLKLKNA